MTTPQKIARRKLSLLDLAADLGNVSKACKAKPISRPPPNPHQGAATARQYPSLYMNSCVRKDVRVTSLLIKRVVLTADVSW